MAGRLRDALVTVDERLSAEATERDVATLFAETGVYETLGYEGTGVDVRSEYQLGDGRRPDLVTLDSAGGVVAAYEFKSPGTTLADHESQLGGYVAAVQADYGVLTDGHRLHVYRRVSDGNAAADGEQGPTVHPGVATDATEDGDRNPDVATDADSARDGAPSGRRTLSHELTVELGRATARDAETLLDRLGKQSYDLRRPEDVNELTQQVEEVALDHPLGREHFFDTFRLSAEGTFGRLVRALVALFEEGADNETVQSSYEYWRATYADLPEDPPDSWTGLGVETGTDRFVFCLETAHALLSRVLLAKAIGDHGLLGTETWILDELAELHGGAAWIEVGRYPEIAASFVTTMRRQVVRGAFRDDVFGWWTAVVPRADPREPFETGNPYRGEWGETPAEQFGRAVGRLLFDVLRFDLGNVSGDLLGSLYQRYFDPETRKTLGEFYTPEALAETILTEVGYDRGVTTARLIDPACGSGTLLVGAVERYLAEVERREESPDWQTHLHRLCTKPLVVGLDIHPFAVLMAQIRFVAAILPAYRKATDDESFTLRRLPIYQTDTLRKEPEESPGAGEQTRLGAFVEGERDVSVPVPLPMPSDAADGTGETTTAGVPLARVRMPRVETVADETAIVGRGEYFSAMQGVMDCVRDHVESHASDPAWDWTYREGVAKHVTRYTDGSYSGLESFFAPYVTAVLDAVSRLAPHRENRWLVDTFEDRLLAVILKNYLSYDYVVGNPPYVRTQTLSADRKRQLDRHYETATGSYDLYCPFYERGLDWLKEGSGRLAYVAPNGFLVTEYGRGLRERLLKDRIERLYDFRDSGVFADATNYPAVVVAADEPDPDRRADNEIRCVRVKRSPDGSADGVTGAGGRSDSSAAGRHGGEASDARASTADNRDAVSTDGTGVATTGEALDGRVMRAIRAHRDEPGYEGRLIDVFDVPQARLDGGPWALLPPRERRAFDRLAAGGDTRLGEAARSVFQGVRTGANGVFVVRVTDTDRVAAADAGGVVRVVPTGGGEPRRIETDLLRPFLAGRDVARWRGDWSGLHLLFPYRPESADADPAASDSEPGADGAATEQSSEASRADERELRLLTRSELASLPETWAYLRAHEETLRDRENGRWRESDQWWAYARTQNLARVGEPKTIGAEIADRATFAIDETGAWAFTTAYGVTFGERATTLAAQLNSGPLDFYLRAIAPIKNDGYYSYRARVLERLPVVTDRLPAVRETTRELLAAADARTRVDRFPAPYLDGIETVPVTYEWQTTRRPVEARVERDGDRFVVAAGRTDRIADAAMAGADRAAARKRAAYVCRGVDGRSVTAGETTRVPIPRRDGDVRTALAACDADRRRWSRTDVTALEARLDRLVADAFGLDRDDRAAIDRSLSTF